MPHCALVAQWGQRSLPSLYGPAHIRSTLVVLTNTQVGNSVVRTDRLQSFLLRDPGEESLGAAIRNQPVQTGMGGCTVSWSLERRAIECNIQTTASAVEPDTDYFW